MDYKASKAVDDHARAYGILSDTYITVDVESPISGYCFAVVGYANDGIQYRIEEVGEYFELIRNS